jgi:multicomponent Na+:H+ antiporter subunit D
MKAGLVPMHMWLPDSYGSAPSTISLILVSATLASLYGVLRVVFTLYGNVLSSIAHLDVTVNVFIGWLVIALAIISIIVGVMMALIQTDFKRLIAFGAVAEIGYMFLGIGAGLAAMGTAYGEVALKGGIFHIFNDALDVGLLFLVAGAIYYATKERSLDQMGGLARNMKYTTIFFIIGLLAVAGMPPMNGFASKLLIYESTFQLNPILAIVAILCSILLLAMFVKVFYSAFMGPALPQFKKVKEVPKSMLIAMGILAVIIIIFGLIPGVIVERFVEPAANALLNYGEYISQVIPTAFGGI